MPRRRSTTSRRTNRNTVRTVNLGQIPILRGSEPVPGGYASEESVSIPVGGQLTPEIIENAYRQALNQGGRVESHGQNIVYNGSVNYPYPSDEEVAGPSPVNPNADPVVSSGDTVSISVDMETSGESLVSQLDSLRMALSARDYSTERMIPIMESIAASPRDEAVQERSEETRRSRRAFTARSAYFPTASDVAEDEAIQEDSADESYDMSYSLDYSDPYPAIDENARLRVDYSLNSYIREPITYNPYGNISIGLETAPVDNGLVYIIPTIWGEVMFKEDFSVVNTAEPFVPKMVMKLHKDAFGGKIEDAEAQSVNLEELIPRLKRVLKNRMQDLSVAMGNASRR